jgi:phage protein U
MLYQLGALSIKIHPFNINEIQAEAATDYVPKPVLGAEPPMEYVGEGAHTWTLSGDLFPKTIGGLDELGILHAMRSRGHPQFLLRGDGVPMGWVVIESVSTRNTHLAADGVGQKISVTVKLRRAGRPSRLALATILLGLFT